MPVDGYNTTQASETKQTKKGKMDLSLDKGNVVNFQQYKERREAQKTVSSADLDSPGRDYRGKLRLTKEDAEMIIYCMRLGREYFMVELEETVQENEQPQKDLDMVNGLLDMIQYEVLKLRGEEGYILDLGFNELAFMLDCVEMTKNAVGKGINVFQWEPSNKEEYTKWLDGTFSYLLYVYEKWRFYQGN